jgi:uncharacterized protein (DUF952 family)
MTIYHITSKSELSAARPTGEYRPVNYNKDGFIHCSFKDQVIKVANSHYRSSSDLVLLKVNTDLVPSRIVEENLEGGEENFPHIYGSLPIDAVTAFAEMTRDANGYFVFPAQLD